MAHKNQIAITSILTHYNIDIQFLKDLESIGRINLIEETGNYFLLEDQLSDLEKMIRLNSDLHINIEGIDAILHLLERLDEMQSQIQIISERLYLLDENWEM